MAYVLQLMNVGETEWLSLFEQEKEKKKKKRVLGALDFAALFRFVRSTCLMMETRMHGNLKPAG